ncbi:helix-turn-helix domain-containing protein [Paenibacillus yanchengensis]|uniref:Helix-turn-helix domain-containing protein n=1 Tax=Paenibacillus yanchengensis TaxID=2035833 RepID=A0ABW4YIK9_9BACL
MEIIKEPIHYQNPLLFIKVWQFEQTVDELTLTAEEIASGVQKVKWHHHKEVEFIVVQQGTHQMQTPNQVYTLAQDEVIVIGSSQLHRSISRIQEKLVYIVLHVDLEAYFHVAMMRYFRHFSEVNQPLERLNYIFQENKEVQRQVAQLIRNIHEEMMNKAGGYEIATVMYIKHLMLVLLRGDTKGLLQPHELIDPNVMKPVLEYVEEHLGDSIDLQQVSDIAGMSYFYFSKYFKKAMGSTFVDYVNRKRIAKAERLLVTSTYKITDIARMVGIESMTHFYNLFKRMNGCTPKQYLQKIDGER